jgi:hypothetical protein
MWVHHPSEHWCLWVELKYFLGTFEAFHLKEKDQNIYAE